MNNQHISLAQLRKKKNKKKKGRKPDESNLILLDEEEDPHPPDCLAPEVLPSGMALIFSSSARTRSSLTSSSSFGTPLTCSQ